MPSPHLTALEPPTGQPRPLRVAYAITSLADGGAERQLLELLRHLDTARFDSYLILLEDTNLERAAGWTRDRFVVGIPSGGNANWVRRLPTLVTAVHRIRGRLRTWRPDVVHAFLPTPCLLAGVAARLARVPVVIGSRRSLAAGYRHGSGPLAAAERFFLRLADVAVANSDAVRDDLRNDGCPESKLTTIRNGVDLRRFHPQLSRELRARFGWSERDIVFGIVGNFRPCKRHVDFIAAAALVRASHPEAKFLMAGADAGALPDVRETVCHFGMAEHCVILDNDPSPEKLFAALDVYVCTSMTEGFSNVLLEAMACGKPVIATRVGGNPEAVVDGVTGFLVPPQRPEAVAACAAQLLGAVNLRLRLGENGRQRAEQLFSLEQMVRSHEELYARVLEQKLGAAAARACH